MQLQTFQSAGVWQVIAGMALSTYEGKTGNKSSLHLLSCGTFKTEISLLATLPTLPLLTMRAIAASFGEDRWPDNAPDTLQEICLVYCVKHLESTLCSVDRRKDVYCLRDGISLPQDLCQSLITTYMSMNESLDFDDAWAHIFSDTLCTKLHRLELARTRISDQGLEWLLAHHPVHVDLSDCPDLTQDTLQYISQHGRNILSLFLGCTSLGSRLFSFLLDPTDDESDEDSESQNTKDSESKSAQESSGSVNELKDDLPLDGDPVLSPLSEFGSGDSARRPLQDTIIDCPNLRALSIHDFIEAHYQPHSVLSIILTPLKDKLTYLDLSRCAIELDMRPCIYDLINLTTLILYDVHLHNLPAVFAGISKLKKLRALDLGHGGELAMIYLPESERHLSALVRSLPELIHLDLSGTNLAGFQKAAQVEHSLKPATQSDAPEEVDPPIKALAGRQFEFLGLLNCSYDACHRDNLPAKQVTGDCNEEQVILSIQMYVEKEALLLLGLNNLFHLCKYAEVRDQRHALQAILSAMKRHPDSRSIQISGSASLFYISKGEEKTNFNTRIKRLIILAILDGMNKHMDEPTMLRNGCLTLCQFKIPQDVMFEYERVVKLLLRMVEPRTPSPEQFVQRIGIYLLNSLACQVDGQEKQLVGDLGAIDTMLLIIRDRLNMEQCDEVMEIAWSTMWNVTDETATNCERFIERGGMELFLQCLKTFSDKEELLRNMMGLLGNVAEVPYLRPRLMHGEFVRVFSNLLSSTSDGIEVSYNACGVLAHMVSDGEVAWTVVNPSRRQVLSTMTTAICKWKLHTKRNINYRSFEPILRLLPKFDTPEAQHWAVWALCNLTKVYRSKYCPLVEKEKGIVLLEGVANDPRPYREIRQLAQQVITRWQHYKVDPDYDSSDEPDSHMEQNDYVHDSDSDSDMEG